jgi:hypothetical protein
MRIETGTEDADKILFSLAHSILGEVPDLFTR